MKLPNELFCERNASIAEQARQLIDKAWEDVNKPLVLAQAALYGAEIRLRVLSLIEKFEADSGQMAVAFAEKEGVLCVDLKLIEEIKKQPDSAILEPSLYLCFPTPDAKRQLNDSWASVVAKYDSRANTNDVLSEKSACLATFIAYNLGIGVTIYGQMREPSNELAEEQEVLAKAEEAACFCRMIDELSFRHLGPDRPLFMDHFGDDLAHLLALQGMPPELIYQTITDRMDEYGQYQKWIPEDIEKEGAKGTLLWEAAKHVGSPLKFTQSALFCAMFGRGALELLDRASVRELLTGRVSDTPS